MPEIGLFEAMYSARALRRLKPDPVPEALLGRVLEAATQAPSGGNAQNWAFVVVRDPAQRAKLGALYRRGSDIVAELYAAAGRPAHLTEAQYARLMEGGAYLWEHLGEAPVLLVPCLHRRGVPPREALPPALAADYPRLVAHRARIAGGNIYPAIQNIILTCRALGLGTLITTNHLLFEAEVKAVLGIPEDVDTFALMPIGYPEGKFGKLARRPVAEVAFSDRWGSTWPG
jgi:nitroreductase